MDTMSLVRELARVEKTLREIYPGSIPPVEMAEMAVEDIKKLRSALDTIERELDKMLIQAINRRKK